MEGMEKGLDGLGFNETIHRQTQQLVFSLTYWADRYTGNSEGLALEVTFETFVFCDSNASFIQSSVQLSYKEETKK